MDIYLPVAGMSINLFFLVSLGGLVGLLSGLFGVGGGFLLTPLLIFAALLGVGGGFIMVPAMIYILGMPKIVAIGTSLF